MMERSGEVDGSSRCDEGSSRGAYAKHEESNGNNETERFIIKMQASENLESSRLQRDIPGMLKRGFHIHASLRNVFPDFTLDERRIIRFIIEKKKNTEDEDKGQRQRRGRPRGQRQATREQNLSK